MSPPILTKVEDTLELDLSPCKGYEFKDALDKIRDFPARRFDYDRKIWIVEATPDNAERALLTIRPEADEDLRAWVRASKTKATENLLTPIADDAHVSVPWATERTPWQPEVVNDEKYTGLLPYQRAAVAVLAKNKRALLADDMGLGKTLEAISAVEEYCLLNGQLEGPRLVVAPNSVKGGWVRELERWLEEANVQLVDSSNPKGRHDQIQRGILDSSWVIINWEQLRVKTVKVPVRHRDGGIGQRKVTLMKEPLLEFPGAADWDLGFEDWSWRECAKAKRDKLNKGWLANIADEIHRAKNYKALQTEGLHRVHAPFMLGLTGTPLMNSPDELWSALHWLFPMEYTSYWDFYYKYVDYYEDDYNRKIVTGVKNPDALRFELRGRLVRRTASILGLKGRKRIYFPVQMTPSQRKLYEDAEREMWLKVEKQIEEGDKDAEAFAAEAAKATSIANLIRIPNGAARLVRLQQIIENCALVGGDDDSALMDDFEQRFADSGNEQWVVGCKFKESCSLLAARLRDNHGANVSVYTGDVDPAARTDIEDAFQKGETQVIVGTIAALKEGITLTNGHLMYQLTEDHVPATNEQFESRCDRLGQQELVRIWKPQAELSVATSNVRPINRVKEKIVRAVVPMDDIKEEHHAE